MFVFRQMNSPVLQATLGDHFTVPKNGHDQSVPPPIDLIEHADYFALRADMPGLSEADIELTVHDGFPVYFRRAENLRSVIPEQGDSSRTADANEQGRAIYSERTDLRFFRRIALSDEINAAEIEASYQHGVLNVRLPKCEKAKPIAVPINSGSKKRLDQ